MLMSMFLICKIVINSVPHNHLGLHHQEQAFQVYVPLGTISVTWDLSVEGNPKIYSIKFISHIRKKFWFLLIISL